MKNKNICVLPTPLSSGKLCELLEIHSAPWPLGLKRFDLLRRRTGDGSELFRAVSWDLHSNRLFVQKVLPGAPPGCLMPIAFDCHQGGWVDDCVKEQESIRPQFMNSNLQGMPASALKGIGMRLTLLNALLMIDPNGEGIPEKYIINDFVLTDSDVRNAVVKQLCQILQRKISYRSYLFGLLTRYIWYGGGPESMANLAPLQGGPGVSRVGINRLKPGRLSFWEKRAKDKAFFSGTEKGALRQRPVLKSDLGNFARVLRSEWAEKRASYCDCYEHLRREYYSNTVARNVPTFTMFKTHARKIIIEDGLKAIRLGGRLSEQHNNSRVGTSSDLTQGVIEILDFDGFIPKLPLMARVNGKVHSLSVRVIFGISRLSNAVLGYELEFYGERARAYRICLGSVFLPKDADAVRLGMPGVQGLLYGNIDAMYVDNGAGASKSVLKMAFDLGVQRMLAPPARGDLKPFVESFNATLVTEMAKEPAGYTRKTDELSKDSRRRSRKSNPITLHEFEKIVVRAIVLHNLCTDSTKLLTRPMRDAGVGITPADIFRYTQAQRRGDAARVITKDEIYDKTFPWEDKICGKGVVTLLKCRYTSPELAAAFDQHAKAPGKKKPMNIFARILPGYEDESAVWKDATGRVRKLNILDEDRRSFGMESEKQRYLDHFSDTSQRENLVKNRRKIAGTITTMAQETILAAEVHLGNPLAGFHGLTVGDSRANATRFRDRTRIDPSLATAQCTNSQSVIILNENSEPVVDSESFEDTFYRSLVR